MLFGAWLRDRDGCAHFPGGCLLSSGRSYACCASCMRCVIYGCVRYVLVTHACLSCWAANRIPRSTMRSSSALRAWDACTSAMARTRAAARRHGCCRPYSGLVNVVRIEVCTCPGLYKTSTTGQEDDHATK